ncbi:Predicted thiol-disulfide oxidoreductase YuxK, DCC family [Rheinheimera pacifica]|uniref:Predicted thiol-disulfide oxidoreductase YuxK, DCC family n=1 Tax=Rheinheimera pacifica TaxID=173990 RepID=A0A1H6MHW8_9GAMM|nr:DCC1-like thiol-disulfide oxidoreductase family protein [Rheinheimera pacifica]SEI01236.1 Predicted thiol-disulfide oxidoreductase YuxK, DCC family [Rheinheimera pacifica]
MAETPILLIYDKDCPACNAYCQMVRIRQSVGELKLINAREDTEIMQQITAQGLDIDQGMVLKMGDNWYYGSDAIYMLSLLSSRSGLFNRLNYHLFKSKRLAKWLYPLLRFCRNLLLKLLGKRKINNLGIGGNDRF